MRSAWLRSEPLLWQEAAGDRAISIRRCFPWSSCCPSLTLCGYCCQQAQHADALCEGVHLYPQGPGIVLTLEIHSRPCCSFGCGTHSLNLLLLSTVLDLSRRRPCCHRPSCGVVSVLSPDGLATTTAVVCFWGSFTARQMSIWRSFGSFRRHFGETFRSSREVSDGIPNPLNSLAHTAVAESVSSSSPEGSRVCRRLNHVCAHHA